MSTSCRRLFLRVAIASLLFPTAQAQESMNSIVDIEPCMNIENSPLRYACYDELAAQVRLSATPVAVRSPLSTITTPPSLETQSPPVSNEAEIASFGIPAEGDIISDRGPVENQALKNYNGAEPRMVARQDGEDELQDRIASLSKRKNNIWEIILESNQVWRQTTAKRLNLKEGALVKIYPSAWGKSYRLEMEGRAGFIQVRRIK